MPVNRVDRNSIFNFEINIIDNEKDFEQSREAWNKLVFSNPRYTVFSTWEWAFSWWQHYSTPEYELHIITVKKNGSLYALAPFYLRHRKIFRTFNMSSLYLIGTGGEEWDEVTSVYLDIIIDAENDTQILKSLVDHIVIESKSRIMDFRDLKANSIIGTKFIHLLQLKGCLHLIRNPNYSFPIKLTKCYDTYLSNLSRNSRKSVKQNKNRFQKSGEITQRNLENTDEIDKYLRIFVKLHMKKHGRNTPKSAFASNRFVKFHRQVLELMLPRGWVDMHFVSLNGQDVSALYNFRFKDTVYSYQSGHCYERWSPGLLADTLAIEEAFQLEMQCYDLLKGKPGTFKNSLGADQEELVSITCYTSSVHAYMNLLYHKLKFIVNKFRKLSFSR